MIEQVVERLRRTQVLLEVASVVGIEFSVGIVAAMTGDAVHQIEAECEQLVRQQQFLRPGDLETGPDGRPVVRYGFHHGLYQEVLYHRLGVGRRVIS